MSEAKRPDPKRRTPASRPGAPGRGGVRASRPVGTRRGQQRSTDRAVDPAVVGAPGGGTEPIAQVRRSIEETSEQQSAQRLGYTARRAAILAALVCVLTLTIAGPVRTYFAQRTEMTQLAATEAALHAQIANLQQQKDQLADPVYIAAQARERLGFVMPGDIPYQVQLPPGADQPVGAGDQPAATKNAGPWYTALWQTIADDPHVPPTPPPAAPPAEPLPPPPPAVPGG